jgi:hypothetical protein
MSESSALEVRSGFHRRLSSRLGAVAATRHCRPPRSPPGRAAVCNYTRATPSFRYRRRKTLSS